MKAKRIQQTYEIDTDVRDEISKEKIQQQTNSSDNDKSAIKKKHLINDEGKDYF